MGNIVLIQFVLVSAMIIPATGAGNQTGDNQTIFFYNPSSISIPLEIRKDIDNEIVEKIASNDIIKEKIAEREKTLLEHPLNHDDFNSTKIQTIGFIAQNNNTKIRNIGENTNSEIPEGGFLEFGADGKTRVFSADGTQIFFENDSETEKVSVSKSTVIPATHSISIPSGATISNIGENVHITYKGKLLLTIIKMTQNDKGKNFTFANNQKISPVSSQENIFVPSDVAGSWIAWAEFKPNIELKSFSTDWIIPHSPSAPNNSDVPLNIIFNGVRPSYGGIIVQPVTAFNDNDFFQDSINWRNNWFGSAYVVKNTFPLSIHSSPIALSEGDAVNGFMYYISDTDEWIVILTDNGQTTQNSSYLFCNFNPNDVDLVTTYEGYFNDTRVNHPNFPIPSNQAKISDIHFYNIEAWDKYLNEIPINWISEYNVETNNHPGLTGIFVDNNTQAPSRITIYTSYSPPNVLTPVAGFSSPSPTTGTAPIAVPMYDSSSNNPTSWSWNFGDGQTSTQQNPVHMYTSPGSYTVSLTATNNAGSNTKTRSSFVSTDSPPSNQHVVNGECNSLTGWTTDGSSGSGGQWYPAQLVSSGGEDGGGYLEMEAFGDPNQVNNHGSAESLMYQDVNLTNVNTLTYWLKSSVFHSTGNGGSTSHFEVYLDNTRIYTTTSAISSWQQFSYSVSGYTGVHRIKFDSYTSNGGKIWADVDSVSAMAQINSPSASFTASSTSGTTPFQVSFSDASTNIPTAWAWDFGDNSTSIGKNPSHTYTASGTYTVKLTVANTAGNNTITRTNYISSNPKTYTITSSAGPGGLISPSGVVNVPEGDSKTFIIQSNSSYFTDTVLVDGSNVTIQGISYTFPDVHSAHTISATFKPLPLANFTANPRTGPAPLTVTFTDTSTGNVTGWNWTFGDGNTTNATERNPVHTYTANGTYTVSLAATNAGGSNTTTRVNYICVGECRDTIGLFQKSTGTFFLRNSNTEGDANNAFAYGLPGDIPLVGDWTGKGYDSIGVYRDGNFLLRDSNTGGWADNAFAYGLPGDIPLVGDWTGKGYDSIGVYRDGNFLLRDSNTGGWADNAFAYGLPGDIPLVGDWTGKGYDSIGVYRDGNFLLRDSNSGGYADNTFGYGSVGNGDLVPLTGHWVWNSGE
jgi:PKD repeat protein